MTHAVVVHRRMKTMEKSRLMLIGFLV